MGWNEYDTVEVMIMQNGDLRWSVLRGSMDTLIELREALRLLEGEITDDVLRAVRHHLNLAEESLSETYGLITVSGFGR